MSYGKPSSDDKRIVRFEMNDFALGSVIAVVLAFVIPATFVGGCAVNGHYKMKTAEALRGTDHRIREASSEGALWEIAKKKPTE